MTQKVKKPHGKLIWKILCGVCAFFLVFSLVGGPIANNYAAIINQVLGKDEPIPEADLNSDGSTNGIDVNLLINILLGLE